MYSASLLFVRAAVLSHRSSLTLAIDVALTVRTVRRAVAEERLLPVLQRT